MSGKKIISYPSDYDKLMEFFIHEFCQGLQRFMNDRTEIGITSEERMAAEKLIVFVRIRNTTVGDGWWFNWLRLETTMETRIERVRRIFARWAEVSGNGKSAIDRRSRGAIKLGREVNRLSKTYKEERHILAKKIDLKILESDIEYFKAARSLGMSAFVNMIDAAVREIFSENKP